MLDELITMDDRQRMVPVDRSVLAEAVERLLQEAATVRGLRHAGLGLVALAEYERAEQVLLQALALAEQAQRTESGEQQGKPIPVLINLGDGYRYSGQFARARESYQQALVLARRHRPDLVDFALQHLGKCHLEQGEHQQAEECLNEALRMRRAKGDPQLIESTQQALRLLPQGEADIDGAAVG